MLVMKFGGSSLATLEHLRRVADIVRKYLDRRPVVVLSAMGKQTNELLAAAERALASGTVDTTKVRQITESVFTELKIPVPAEISELLEELSRILSGIALLKEISTRTRDLVVSFGERMSIRTFTAVFNHTAPDSASKLQAKAIDSWEAGVLTSSGGGSSNSAFTQCEVLPQTYTNLASYFFPLRTDYKHVPIVTGYVAKDGRGTITTLGRDGSDLSATVIGAALVASEVQIWKDVSGLWKTHLNLLSAKQQQKPLVHHVVRRPVHPNDGFRSRLRRGMPKARDTRKAPPTSGLDHWYPYGYLRHRHHLHHHRCQMGLG